MLFRIPIIPEEFRSMRTQGKLILSLRRNCIKIFQHLIVVWPFMNLQLRKVLKMIIKDGFFQLNHQISPQKTIKNG